jgi:hypothetical protein
METHREAEGVPDRIRTQLPGLLETVRQLLPAVVTAEEDFARGQPLTYAQCSRATDPLRRLDKPLSELSQLFASLSPRPDVSLSLLKILPRLRSLLDELQEITARVGNDHAHGMSTDLREQALRSIRQAKTSLEHMVDLLQKIPPGSSEGSAPFPSPQTLPEPFSPGEAVATRALSASQPPASSARSDAPTQEPALFSRLYAILKALPILDLREICHELAVDYQRLSGTSNTEKALSLAEEMQLHNRLAELHIVLQRRYPKRF